jgi:hypothetical protein
MHGFAMKQCDFVPRIKQARDQPLADEHRTAD